MSNQNNLSWIRELIYSEDKESALQIYRAMDRAKHFGKPTDEVEMATLRDHLKKDLPEWFLSGIFATGIYRGFNYENIRSFMKHRNSCRALDIVKALCTNNEGNLSYVLLDSSSALIRFDVLPGFEGSGHKHGIGVLSTALLEIDTRSFFEGYIPNLNYSMNSRQLFSVNYNIIQKHQDPVKDALTTTAKLIGDPTYFDHLFDEEGNIRRPEY